MPPKVRIKSDDIFNVALGLVRIGGEQAINARALAASMNCSTQPVFSNFASMDELLLKVNEAAYEHYLSFIKRELESGKYPQYKAYGMAYIRFAREERELFKFLFMCDRTGKDLSPSPDFDDAVEVIMKVNGITKEKAMLLHLEMWSCVHGIGTMLATSFLPLGDDLISKMLSDIYLGTRARLISEEDQNERDKN